MRFAAVWMTVTAVLILAYIWPEHKFYLPKPEPWQTEKGEILSNKIQAVKTDAGPQFKVDILYRYHSGDSIREGTRIRPDEFTYPSMQQAERAAKAFPVGKEVKVYINPQEKSQPPSVLIWEFPDVLSPVVFIIIILVATAVVLYLIAEYQKFRK
ncbi:MAG: DUF3592 domain-containing protein [Methylococcales bacterium]